MEAFTVWGLGFRDSALGLRVEGSRLRIEFRALSQ